MLAAFTAPVAEEDSRRLRQRAIRNLKGSFPPRHACRGDEGHLSGNPYKPTPLRKNQKKRYFPKERQEEDVDTGKNTESSSEMRVTKTTTARSVEPPRKRSVVTTSFFYKNIETVWFPHELLWTDFCRKNPVSDTLVLSDWRVRDDDLLVVGRVCHQVNVLELARLTEITSLGLMHLCHFDNCTKLDLSGCPNVDDRTAEHLRKNFTKLNWLDVSRTAIGDIGLGHIFAGVRNLETLRLRGCNLVTSKGLIELAAYAKLRKTIRNLDIGDNGSFSNDSLLLLLTEAGGRFHELLIDGCQQVNSQALLGLRRSVGKLELRRLDLSNLKLACLGPTLLQSLSVGCPHLTELRLAGLGKAIDDSALHAYTIQMTESNSPPTLKSLVLSGCSEITSKGLGPFLKYFASSLTDLDVSLCSRLDDDFGIHLAEMNNLHRLKMVDMPLFSDLGFLSLVSRVRDLEEMMRERSLKEKRPKWIDKRILEKPLRKFGLVDFDASAALTGSVDSSTRCRVPRYGSKGLIVFVKSFGATLVSLNLSGAPRVDDTAVICVANHCLLMERVGLDKCSKVSSVGVTNIAEKCVHLQRLSVPGCGGNQAPLTDTVPFALGKCSNELRVLDLSRSRVTGAGCRALARGCRKLQVLKLNDCDRVDDEGVCALLKGCPDLRILNMAGCDELCDAGFASLSSENYYCLEVCDLHRASMGRGVAAPVLVRAAQTYFPLTRRNASRCGFEALPLSVKKFVTHQLRRRHENSAARLIQCLERARRGKMQFIKHKARVVAQRQARLAAIRLQTWHRVLVDRRAGRVLLESQREARKEEKTRAELEIARKLKATAERRAKKVVKFVCMAFMRYRTSLLYEAWCQFLRTHIEDIASQKIGKRIRDELASRLRRRHRDDCSAKSASAILIQRFIRWTIKRGRRHFRLRVQAKEEQEDTKRLGVVVLTSREDVASTNREEVGFVDREDATSPNLEDVASSSGERDQSSTASDTAELHQEQHALRTIAEKVCAIGKIQTSWRFAVRRRAFRKRRAGSLLLRNWRKFKLRRMEIALLRRQKQVIRALKRLASPSSIMRIVEIRENAKLVAKIEAERRAILRVRAVLLIQRVMRSRCLRWKATNLWRNLRHFRAAETIRLAYLAYRCRSTEWLQMKIESSAAAMITRCISCWYSHQKYRKLHRAMAIRKERTAKSEKHNLIKRKQERILQSLFLGGREKSASRLQRIWREHREDALLRAKRVSARETILRDVRFDFALTEKTAEARRSKQKASKSRSIAIGVARAGAKLVATGTKLAASAVGPPQPSAEDVVRKGYELPAATKPKARDRIVNLVLDRKPSQEQQERDEQLENSIINLQSRSLISRGITDLALTVGKNEVVAMEEKNVFNARTNQPVFVKIKKDLSGTKKLKAFLWYSIGSGPRVLTDIRVRRAPPDHLNKTLNESRVHGASLGGTVIRGHEKLAVEVHGDAGVFMGRSETPIEIIAISRNRGEETELKSQKYVKISPALSVGGTLEKYYLWIRRRKVHDHPVLNTLLMGQLRAQAWWNGDDDRVRTVIAAHALPLEAVLNMRKKFDSLNFANLDRIDVDDWLKSVRDGDESGRPAYVKWLFDLVELQSPTESYMDFGEYMAIVTTLCMFDKLELLRWVFKSGTGREKANLSKESFNTLISGLLKNNPLPYQRSAFEKLFEKYSSKGNRSEIFFQDFVAIAEKLPVATYMLLRFQGRVMKANCGKDFWFKRKLEFKDARDRIGVERQGMNS